MTIPVRVTIDGPSATGKTTLGMWLADRLDASFLDTGLTFRAVALAIRGAVERPPDSELEPVIHRIGRRPHNAKAGHTGDEVHLDGVDVTNLIWSESCNGLLPWVTDSPRARQLIHELHRSVTPGPVVVAGRDTATHLYPQATLHVVLLADFAVRRQRRRIQVEAGGRGTPVTGASSPLDAETLEAVSQRPNSLVIDTTSLRVEEVQRRVEEVMGL